MAVGVRVTTNFAGLKKFHIRAKGIARGKPTGAFRSAMKTWGKRYLKFIKDRFLSYSKGGGNWPPLTDKTIKRKRRKGAKYTKSILREFGHSYSSIPKTFRKTKGWDNRFIRAGISMGWAPRKHPNSNASYARLMYYHARDGRETIVEPPDSLTAKMATDLEKAMQEEENKLAKEAPRK